MGIKPTFMPLGTGAQGGRRCGRAAAALRGRRRRRGRAAARAGGGAGGRRRGGAAVGWRACLRETRYGSPRGGCTRHWPAGC